MPESKICMLVTKPDWQLQVELACCGCVVSECCVSCASFVIVRNEFDDGGWDVCLWQLSY